MTAPRGFPPSPVQHGTVLRDHTGLLSAPSWRTVVRIADEAMTTFLKLPIQIVEEDVGQERRQGTSLGHTLWGMLEATVNHHSCP
jgi:hypothetical protein